MPTPTQLADIYAIEQLQRLYAKATDTIGRGGEADIAAGRALYHRIYTPDVQIRTANTGGKPLTATGPDAWVDVVHSALKDYTGTQHLIGTQLVELGDAEGQAVRQETEQPTAIMESYVNAWHKNADGSVYLFLGTYISKVRHSELGWQIFDMTLRMDSTGTVQTE